MNPNPFEDKHESAFGDDEKSEFERSDSEAILPLVPEENPSEYQDKSRPKWRSA